MCLEKSNLHLNKFQEKRLALPIYIVVQHTMVEDVFTEWNKQASQLFFKDFFRFFCNECGFTMWSFRTNQNIILHKVAHFFCWLHGYFLLSICVQDDDCADDFLQQTKIWACFLEDFLFITFFCHCGTKLNQKTFRKRKTMRNGITLKNNQHNNIQ